MMINYVYQQRTYGPWWKYAPSGKRKFKRTPPNFISEDYIGKHFKHVKHTGIVISEKEFKAEYKSLILKENLEHRIYCLLIL